METPRTPENLKRPRVADSDGDGDDDGYSEGRTPSTAPVTPVQRLSVAAAASHLSPPQPIQTCCHSAVARRKLFRAADAKKSPLSPAEALRVAWRVLACARQQPTSHTATTVAAAAFSVETGAAHIRMPSCGTACGDCKSAVIWSTCVDVVAQCFEVVVLTMRNLSMKYTVDNKEMAFRIGVTAATPAVDIVKLRTAIACAHACLVYAHLPSVDYERGDIPLIANSELLKLEERISVLLFLDVIGPIMESVMHGDPQAYIGKVVVRTARLGLLNNPLLLQQAFVSPP